MISLIHGNDIASSRNYYFEEKNKLTNPILLEGEGLTYDQLFQAVENKLLFEAQKTILIESFFTENKTNSVEFKKIIGYINANKEIEIIFWEPVELSKTTPALLENATIKTFSFPKLLFSFLDAIKPDNYEALIKLFNDLKQNMELELIFFMLVRQFRLMLNQLDQSNKIDEVKRMAPWQLSKLDRQAKLFGIDKLKKLYRDLFEMDLKMKTGKIPYSLECSIDFFLLGL